MTAPSKYRDVAIKRFHGSRESLLKMVKANSKGLNKDQIENGEAQVKEMAKLVKTIEAAAPTKTMSAQWAKFMEEWTKLTKGKGMGQVAHYLDKMGKTEFGKPPPPRPGTPAPSTRPAGR